MNSVNIIGRVGGEIELRYTPSGKAVAALTLAVDDGFGENKKTAWIGVTLWGATAECASKYVRKGDRLGISGRLSQEEWEDKATGKKQRKTKVTFESMDLLTDKRSEGGTESADPPSPRRQPVGMPSVPPATNDDEEEEDNLPF